MNYAEMLLGSVTYISNFIRLDSGIQKLKGEIQRQTDRQEGGIISLLLFYQTKEGLCGLVVSVPAYRSRGPGSNPGATRFSEKYWVWNGVHSAS
jgi:hypothetical protein